MKNGKILLVCSSGGHLFELFLLKDYWAERDRRWVSFPVSDAKYLLKDEDVVWANHPTNRNIPNLLRNFLLSWRILREYQPTLILSTGAGVGVPFIVLGSLFGIKTVFLESITRIEELSLSAKLVYFFVDKLLVQWPELVRKYRKTEFHGQVL